MPLPQPNGGTKADHVRRQLIRISAALLTGLWAVWPKVGDAREVTTRIVSSNGVQIATESSAPRKHVAERVVKDRNRITGGGVTAGVDFALAVIEEIRGPEEAKAIQLMLEYDPMPLYDCGTPDRASPETIQSAKKLLAKLEAEAIRAGQEI